MFTLRIKIDSSDLQGLQALDERRRLGLDDNKSTIKIDTRVYPLALGEKEARLLGGLFQDWNTAYAYIPLSLFCKGEVVESRGLIRPANITPQRGVELVLATRR